MISVLTLTYKRHYLLEEAIQSFLEQDFTGECEMVIINDSPEVEYVFDHEKIHIINLKDRFLSLGEKLEFGFRQCKYNYIYRLDDDDLLAPWALTCSYEDIKNNPGYDIYRSDGHYYFENNVYKAISGSVNNGNVYWKDYITQISIPKVSYGEDEAMTFGNKGRIYESHRSQKTMLYRWGMQTYHVSGMGSISNEAMREWTENIVKNKEQEDPAKLEKGILHLKPHFDHDYYSSIR